MADRGSGQLFERVAFDERANVSDGEGNVEGEFVEQFTCRAGFTFLRGGETVIAGRLEGRQPVVVRVRSSSNTREIAPDWRMRDLRTGKEYAVRSVIPTQDRLFIDVAVESGTPA
jgi:head-tail adaptor